jgi:hypothetical protein
MYEHHECTTGDIPGCWNARGRGIGSGFLSTAGRMAQHYGKVREHMIDDSQLLV